MTGCGRKIGPYECCTVVCGDCLELMKAIPDGAVDAVITDPPYGIDFNRPGSHARFSGHGVTLSARRRGNPPVYGDDKPFDPWPLMRFGNVLVWGADHFYTRLPDFGRWLAWNKLGDMEPWDSFSDVEFAWHSQEGAARVFSMKWKGIACEKAGEDNGLRVHTTQKPIRLMIWCIEQAKFPETVLDPFLGSGTTAVAAKKLGRHFLGMEISETYCQIARERIALVEAQPSLFERKPEQLTLTQAGEAPSPFSLKTSPPPRKKPAAYTSKAATPSTAQTQNSARKSTITT